MTLENYTDINICPFLRSARYQIFRLIYSFLFSGGLFEPEYQGQEIVFKYAVDKVNKRRDVLPLSRLEYQIQNSPMQDSFDSSRKGKWDIFYVIVYYCSPCSTNDRCFFYRRMCAIWNKIWILNLFSRTHVDQIKWCMRIER